MFLTAAQPIACFENYPKGNYKAENQNKVLSLSQHGQTRIHYDLVE